MKKYLWLILVAIVFFATNQASATDTPTADNFINVNIMGDRVENYSIVGEDASAIFMGFANNQLKAFSLIFNTQDGVQLQTGAFTLDLSSRAEQKGSDLAMVNFNVESEKWQDQFNSQAYPLYYDATPDNSESATYITLSHVEQIADGYLLLQGKFRFNAASSPAPEDIPKEALSDALENTGRKPPYRPDLAGTGKISAAGDFKVAVLVKPFGW